MVVIGAAGKLPARRQQIVAPGLLRGDPQGETGPSDDLRLTGRVIVPAGEQKGKIQIAQVVEHRPAPGEAAGETPAFLLQEAGAALLPGVLVAADDHGVPVLPQVQGAAALPRPAEQQLLPGQVFIGVEARSLQEKELSDHGFCQRRMGWRAARTSSGRAIWA